MKIAVISDVHGNVPALQSVLEDIRGWAPDKVIVNGDLINRGPLSLEAYELLQHEFPETEYVKGNHEEFVLRTATLPVDETDPVWPLTRFTVWTVRQMHAVLDKVAEWPDDLELSDPGGGRVSVTHGSYLGNRDPVRSDTPDEELPPKLGHRGALFITAHTHTPLIREFDQTLIVNVGSVGSPFDRDPRAAYGRLTFKQGRWRATIRRVSFDRTRAERNFFDSGFIEEGGPLVRVMLTELRQCRGFMGRWMRTYYDAVHDGHISVERAVEEYLNSIT